MNGKLAKAIRKEVYKGKDFRDRTYTTVNKTVKADTVRSNYQLTKKKYV